MRLLCIFALVASCLSGGRIWTYTCHYTCQNGYGNQYGVRHMSTQTISMCVPTISL